MIVWKFDCSKIADAREANDLTAAELARKIGVAQHQVVAWEKGNTEPGQKYLTAICTALQCPPRYFFASFDDDNHQNSA